MWSFSSALADPVEAGLMRPFLAGTATDDDRRAYQAWLIAAGDPRGELLALAMALGAATEPPAARARFRELLDAIDPLWWAMVRARGWLLNCGSRRDQPAAVRFAYECPRQWEELDPTLDPAIRQCEQCGEAVFAVATLAEAEDHARRGHCISVPSALAGAVDNREVPHRAVIGRPHAPTNWARRLFGD